MTDTNSRCFICFPIYGEGGGLCEKHANHTGLLVCVLMVWAVLASAVAISLWMG